MAVEQPETIHVTCPRCGTTSAITPYIPLKLGKKEPNAGHSMVLGSKLTCRCGKIL